MLMSFVTVCNINTSDFNACVLLISHSSRSGWHRYCCRPIAKSSRLLSSCDIESHRLNKMMNPFKKDEINLEGEQMTP